MDPMTQSAQISSSQGFADGQNSAAKESKLSDSFLSSSPVSLIQSPQDKRVVPGSEKAGEGVATSLRFSAQPASFSPSNYGSEAGSIHEQQDSPIKVSPVSERIKALEALTAKKKEPDFRGNGGFTPFKDRHHEKSSSEVSKSPTEVTKSPAEWSKSPTEVTKSPAEVTKSPAEVTKSPAEVTKSPAEVTKSPAEVSKSPADVSKSPADVSKSPAELTKSPAEVTKSPADVSKSPADVTKSPPEESKSPADVSKSPAEVTKSPAEVTKSPADVSKSPADVSKSPANVTKSPPEESKSPAEVIKSLSEPLKYSSEKITPTLHKVEDFADQESPESPFEILEETEQWMKAHLPPVPDFDAGSLIKGTNTFPSKVNDLDAPAGFAGVPDAFMDPPVEDQKLQEEFDVSFLPTAYMWDQQEKASVDVPSNLESVIQFTPAPPADFSSTSPVSALAYSDANQNFSHEKGDSWSGDLEQPETSEADSSGDSDDTVIEDNTGAPASSVPPTSNDAVTAPTAPAATITEKEIPPPKSERKLMQVPTINVIETDEPNYSEEEMDMEPEAEEAEDYEVVKDHTTEAPKASEPENSKTELPKTRPLETEFMEGYSPPSSPVDSEEEYSPKHKILKSVPETDYEPSPLKTEDRPNPAGQLDSTESSLQEQFDQSLPTLTEVKPELSSVGIRNEEVDFPNNDDEWSEVIQDTPVKPGEMDLLSKVDEKSKTASKEVVVETAPPCRPSFMQDDIYDRVSFDYDFDVTASLDHNESKGLSNAKERFLSDTVPRNVAEGRFDMDRTISLSEEDYIKPDDLPPLEEYPPNPYSCFESEKTSTTSEQRFIEKMTTDDVSDKIKSDNTPLFPKPGSDILQEPKMSPDAPDTTTSSDGVKDSSSVSEPTNSFVEFMRECLKSRQDEEEDGLHQGVPSTKEFSKTLSSPYTSPSMVMDLEQEHLTISALKELGSSQDEEELMNLPSKVSAQPTSSTLVPNPSCSQGNSVFDNTYSREVEAIDEWVAEAYHLAEHVLMAILSHLSVKDLIHWRDPKKSGLVFGLSMLLLLSLAAFSVISVASYLLLALLCVTITFRIYKSVVQAVQKSAEGHPFKALIEKDVSIPPETFRKHVDTSLTYINRALKQMSRLFLVEDLVDSLKLAVVMWLLTYVGAVFNGITILILADILLFAVPPVYEKNKTQIDQYIDLVRTQVNTTIAKLHEKLPGAVKRAKTE